MIRAGQEEFFIEPLERGGDMTGEEEGGPGRHHIVYRSSDIKKPAVNQPADFHPRGQIPFMTPARHGALQRVLHMHADDYGGMLRFSFLPLNQCEFLYWSMLVYGGLMLVWLCLSDETSWLREA